MLMEINHSFHWKKQRKYRKDIPDDFIVYAVSNSPILRDKIWPNVYNAISRIPPSGRLLKVVYRRINKDRIIVVTAFWLD